MGTDTTSGPGSRIGPYQLLERLGGDGPGPVYRARDVLRSRSVVVRLLPDLAAETRQRLAGELVRLAAIQHPNALEVVDHGEHGEAWFVVTVYVPGGSLAAALRDRTLSREAGLGILAGVAGLMDHLHAEGVVHGGLKPTSVLLGAGGRPFVTDIGVAALAPQKPPGTGAAPAYRAPELAGGRTTAAADRHAFAAIAAEILAGTSPPVETGPALAAVLERGLAADPGEHWPSCGQMLGALKQALADDEARATTGEPATPGAAPIWRWIAVAAVLATALAAVATFLVGRTSQPSGVGITLSDSVVPAGGTVVILGDHLRPHQAGTIELHGQAMTPMGAFEADQYGNMATRLAVPDDVRSGAHLIELCWQGSCHASARLRVVAAPLAAAASPAPPSSVGLDSTPANSPPTLVP